MLGNLKLLLDHGFISRKQYRELNASPPATPAELKARLIQPHWIDPPDWKEIEKILSGDPQGAGDMAPESINSAMKELMVTSHRVAPSDTTILILGESGVGKSRLARRIHQESPRRRGPLVTISCGSFPETLLESELFGVEKGAFTGATRSREGRFQKADGGTIFLDEIGELPPSLQVKLLRVIQERKIEPLGSEVEIAVNVRIIAATNRNLERDVQSGLFREDLFFRLNVVPLTILPLRERKEDILPLTHFFLTRNSQRDRVNYTLEADVELILTGYSWPGNIRELENCIERLCVLSEDATIRRETFPERILREVSESGRRATPNLLIRPLEPEPEESRSVEIREVGPLEEMEQEWIRLALQRSGGNISEAASILKIHRNTLSRKMSRYGIPGESPRSGHQ